MIVRLTGYIALAAVAVTAVDASVTTWTEMRCRTLMGSMSPHAVATHTTVQHSQLPTVTIAWTTQETETLSLGPLPTIHKTETTYSTTTETVTQKVKGSTFTTTSTIALYDLRFVNITSTQHEVTVTSETFTVSLLVPTADGWMPVSTTKTTTSTSSDLGPLATDQVVYILESGHLRATPLSAVGDLIETSTKSTSLGSSTSTSTKSIKSITTTTSVATNARGDPITTIPSTSTSSTTPTSNTMTDAAAVRALLKAMSAAEAKAAAAAAATATANPTDVPSEAISSKPSNPTKDSLSSDDDEEYEDDLEALVQDPEPNLDVWYRPRAVSIESAAPSPTKKTLVKRQAAPAETTGTESQTTTVNLPKHYYGLRGALETDPSRPPPSFPTEVGCTKLILSETTVYAPFVLGPVFMAETAVTKVSTTVKVMTETSTVPSPSPFKTASFVTTTVVTMTTTHRETTTQSETRTHSVFRTTTAIAACATDNLVGPVAAFNSHVVNVYARGGKYTAFDVGGARDAAECCAECHEMQSPCLGSVWDNRLSRCYLMSDHRGKCADQSKGAGLFVTRPETETSGIGRHEWPDWVLSNGPCGYWMDGGTGW